MRLKELETTDVGNKIGVSMSNVVLSVCLAIIHVIFELVSLFVESNTSESPFL